VIDVALSDDAWQRIKHLLPWDSKRRFDRTARDPQDVLNTIFWVITRNEKWHSLPPNYPPAQACSIKWLQCRPNGLMSKILLS